MDQKFSEFRESDSSLKHERAQLKDPVCYLCLAGVALLVLCILVSYIGGGRFE